MNEDELLEFNYKNPTVYKNPTDWCKLGTKFSWYGNEATGTIIDFDKIKGKNIVHVSWDKDSLNAFGGYRKYNKDYLNKEITKGTIKLIS